MSHTLRSAFFPGWSSDDSCYCKTLKFAKFGLFFKKPNASQSAGDASYGDDDFDEEFEDDFEEVEDLGRVILGRFLPAAQKKRQELSCWLVVMFQFFLFWVFSFFCFAVILI